jgi:hypothetical protein
VTPGGAQLRRLTISQYTNTIHAILPNVTITSNLEDVPTVTASPFLSVGAAQEVPDSTSFDDFEASALDIANQVFSSDTARTALVGCSTYSDACATTFLQTFGRQAWRRSLTSDEVTAYLTGAKTIAAMSTNAPWSGLQYVTAGLLFSPNFLYIVEVGEDDPTLPGRQRYTSTEMASRLSYFLTDGPPDATLLTAGEAGQLTDPTTLQTQAQRLLATTNGNPQAAPRIVLHNFFDQLLDLDRLETIAKDTTVFPNFSSTLGASMHTEFKMVVDSLAFDDPTDFRNLFTNKNTFVNAELAKVYNLPAPSGTGFVAATIPASDPREGFFGMGAFLMPNAHLSQTSLTERGKEIRTMLLCTPIKPVPAGTNTTPPTVAGVTNPTLRQSMTIVDNDNADGCSSCHSQMDPIGFGFEHFDAIGQYRLKDQYGNTLDTTGNVDGTAFADLASESQVLHDDAKVSNCMVNNLYSFATGHAAGAEEQPTITSIEATYSNGYKMSGMLQSIVTSDGFRYRIAD